MSLPIPRPWDQIAPSVKAFVFSAPLMLLGLTGMSLRRKAFLWPSSFPARSQVPASQDPFASSWLLSPALLGTVRLCCGLWSLYVWQWMFANPPENSGFKVPFDVWAFFTIWNYLILSLYFFASSLYSFARVLNPHGAGCSGLVWNLVRGAVWSLYQQQLPSSFLVAFVFWVGVYPNLPAYQRPFFRNLSSLNQHLFNFLMLALDGCLNNMPVHLPHAVFMLSVSTAYLYYGVWVHGCVPSMSFLDLGQDAVAGVLVAVLLFNFLSYLLAWWASNKKFTYLGANLGGARTHRVGSGAVSASEQHADAVCASGVADKLAEQRGSLNNRLKSPLLGSRVPGA